VTTPRGLRLMLAGQSLIERPLHTRPTAPSPRVRELLADADLAVTNLEVAIDTAGGWPVRDATSHVAPESVLDTLAWFGFRAVALASNHAFDLGPAGIVAALDATRRRGMITAGTGLDAASAAAPGAGVVAGTRVALLGVVAAANPPSSHALDAHDGVRARPGVNRLRVHERLGLDTAERALLRTIEARRAAASDLGEPGGPLMGATLEDGAGLGARRTPDETDVASLLRQIRIAARSTDIVVVYLHNHYWARSTEVTPGWVASLARRCVDEGASVVMGHGTPTLQGFEFHRGHLIAYGLGSFVFHTHRGPRYDTTAWESVLVDLGLRPDGTAEHVRLHPLVHGMHPDRPVPDEDDGAPTPAEGATARSILDRVARLCTPFGARVVARADGTATLWPADERVTATTRR